MNVNYYLIKTGLFRSYENAVGICYRVYINYVPL